MKKHYKSIIYFLIAASAAGCATQRETNRQIQRSNDSLNKKEQVSNTLLAANNKVVFRSAGAWLGNKPIPVSKELMLPAVFRQSFEFRFPMAGRVSLTTFAERFTRITGIPVQINQDVYDALKIAESASGSSAPNMSGAAAGVSSSGGTTGNAVDGVFSPAGILGFSNNPAGTSNSRALANGARGVNFTPPPISARYRGPNQFGSSLSNVSGSGLNSFEMNFSGTPKALLDQISARLGGSWEYRNGVVIISRIATQIFTLKTGPGTVSFGFQSGKDSSIKIESGQSGGGGGEIKSGFTSASSTSSAGSMSALDEVLAGVKAVLSPQGKATVNQATSTITVTDTKDGLERAGRIIERENEILSRTAKFRIEVYSIRTSDQDQAGVSWDAIFKNISDKFQVAYSAPAAVVEQITGNIGVKVLSGRFTDTSAMLRSMAENGKINNVYSVDVVTRNRRPTPVAVTKRTAYLAKTVPATSSSPGGNTSSAPGLEPGNVTTGFNLQLQPNILDSNQVALQFSLGVIDLIDIKTISSAGQTIQLPETSGFEFMQDVALRPGETLVLTGYDRESGNYTDRSIAPSIPSLLGGSYKGSTSKEKLAILITPISIGVAN